MEEFNLVVGLFLCTLIAYTTGTAFFSIAILRQLRNERFLPYTLWGFAFLVLGYLGNYFLRVTIPR